jgi:virulence-associated protein VapD
MKKFRKNEIIKYSTGKRVLHLGFIQHENLWRNKIEENDWLHSQVLFVASKAVGVDYLQNEVKIIKQELGIECYFGDVTKLEELDLVEKFDIIICGELIEHISNAGLMLDGLKRFMNKDSKLIITTPNPWRDLWVQNICTNNNEINWLNKEHVCWYSYQTLKQLLQRHDFKEVDYDYYYAENYVNENISISKKIKNVLKQFFGIYSENKNIKNKYEGLFFVSKL